MARISTYPLDESIQGTDKWIGSDSVTKNATKNFTAEKVAQYLNSSGVIESQTLRYMYQDKYGQEPRLMGTISFNPVRGESVPFSSIDTFLLSAYAKPTKDVHTFYSEPLIGAVVLITNATNVSNWALYYWNSSTQDIDEPLFYNIGLTFISGDGGLFDRNDYIISMFSSGGGSSGNVSGFGTTNKVAKWINPNTISDSVITDNGTNVGIGTDTPVGKLDVRTTDSFGAVIFNNDDSNSPFWLKRANNGGVAVNTFSSNGTIDIPTDRDSIGYLSRFTGQAYIDTAFRPLARMEYYITSTPTVGNAPTGIRFLTVKGGDATYNLNERMGITDDGNVQIGESIINNRNSKLLVKGIGTTASTTALLVQNSAGSNLLSVKDDGLLSVSGQSIFYANTNAPDTADYFWTDINPLITAGADNQVISMLRLRDRGFSNTGGFTNTLRLAVVMENAGGGEFPFQLFSDTGKIRVGYSTVAAADAQLNIQGSGTTASTTSLLIQNSASSPLFKVLDNGVIMAQNMPTSSAGLAAGSLWSDGGTIKIV